MAYVTADADGVTFQTQDSVGVPGQYRAGAKQKYAAFSTNSSLGWVEVTSSRSLNTEYVNTGYLRIVNVFGYLAPGYGHSIQVKDQDTLNWITTATATFPVFTVPEAYVYYTSITVVKPLQSYRVIAAAGSTGYFQKWSELR
jgi:hypothetical protein